MPVVAGVADGAATEAIAGAGRGATAKVEHAFAAVSRGIPSRSVGSGTGVAIIADLRCNYCGSETGGSVREGLQADREGSGALPQMRVARSLATGLPMQGHRVLEVWEGRPSRSGLQTGVHRGY